MSTYAELKNSIKDWPVLQPIRPPLMAVDSLICNMFGRDPDFVIAGTGRSGTVYLAWLINELGIPTRHEYFFGPDGYHKRIGVRGEVSWMVVPYLQDFKGTILHQTRHPVKTINSFVSMRGFDPTRMHNKYIRFIDQHFHMTDNLIEDSMRFYIEWNKKAEERAVHTFQIEKIAEELPRVFREIGEECPSHYREVIEKSQKLNSKSKPIVTYEDLPKGKLLDELAAVSEAYGYKIDEV